MYLDDAQVRDLSRDIAALAGVRYWILDLASPAILEMMQKGMGAALTNAPLKFAPNPMKLGRARWSCVVELARAE